MPKTIKTKKLAAKIIPKDGENYDHMAEIRAFTQTDFYKQYAKEEDERIMVAVFAKMLRNLRKAKKLTQKQLAQKVGFEQSQIARWENAKDVPNLKTLFRICSALDSRLEIIY